ncbi:MAG: gluconeogenesis factor YvcK family protein [bacterium]
MQIKKVVTIGGGTGSFVLLSGLKKYPIKLSAIVSMADNGGSTGILRDELGVLPPGDIRQCLVALSDSSNEMRKLMNYRFESGIFKGHSFGNLFLTVLEKINNNFLEAINQAGNILNIKGEIVPVTTSNVNLYMELKNGKILKGENEISLNKNILKKCIKLNFCLKII